MLSKEEKNDLTRIDSEIYGSSAMAGIGQCGRMQVGSPGDQEILKHLKYFKMFMRREKLLDKIRPSENRERLNRLFDILAERRFFEGDYMQLVDYLVGDTEIKPKVKLDWIKELWKLTVLIDCLYDHQCVIPGSETSPYAVFADCFTHKGKNITNQRISDAKSNKLNLNYDYKQNKNIRKRKERAIKDINTLKQFYSGFLE